MSSTRHRERGSLAFDTFISGVFLIFTVVGASTLVAAATGSTVTVNQGASVHQLAREMLQRAEATPWAELGVTADEADTLAAKLPGFMDGAQVNGNNNALPASKLVVLAQPPVSKNRPDAFTSDHIIPGRYGVRADVIVAVTWDGAAAATSGGLGTKRVDVLVRWRDKHGDDRVYRRHVLITPKLSEVTTA